MTDSGDEERSPTADHDSPGDADDAAADIDVSDLLDRAGFDAEENVLTARQAEVLALREQGLRQLDIAERLGTSRANVSNIEGSARENIAKASETVSFAESLSAPVRVEIPADTDLYRVPNLIYDAADEADVKVSYTAPDLMSLISDRASAAVKGRNVKKRLFVSVTADGSVQVRQSSR
ncbi:Tfx family DNA-binding protein [Halonotius terrestris]|uniref:Tfx family DNA-binding protein n=1 Tax=Halonotius terrestris TaxID=2487750 RepID=A0A8J8TC94_9EURY|nr:Tfx family DNA-binding protein [Halonotius terrestris]TQQ82967.1 Tfx family DNA-binding protein [Halonotius terrestris]